MQLDDLFIDKSDEIFDVIIVGSGITGGWAAKEFAERGFKTLMVERGRKVIHRQDYPTEGKGPWEFDNRTLVDKKTEDEEYNIQKKCYAFSDQTKHFFGNDKDLPYTTEKNTGFTWIRGNQLGGKSLTWHRQCYRMSDFDFNANKADGHGNDWPIRYKDVAPWYSYVEKFAGISGGIDNLEQLPDGEHLPPFEFNNPELSIKEKLEKFFPDRTMIMGRTAHLSKPEPHHMQQGRIQCQTRNECQKGCSFGAYFSTQSATLPAAAKTGNLRVATDSVVHSVIYDETKNRVAGVRIIDANTKEQREFRGKIVFLCASTLGSTQVLLHSTSKAFPNGLANSSGVLGHYLMDHCFAANAGGEIVGFEDETDYGRRPTGVYIPNFQYEPKRYHSKYKRGFAIGGGAGRGSWRGLINEKGIGVNYKEAITRPGNWEIHLYAQGEMLPRFENSVSLNDKAKDAWGIPQLHMDVSFSENEHLMMDDAAAQMHQILEKAGVKNVFSNNYINSVDPGIAIHEVGTARMGRDPKSSVLNGYNQSHDVPNLFVTDGASYCSVSTVNPSLTFMALTARAVDFAAKEVKNKRI